MEDVGVAIDLLSPIWVSSKIRSIQVPLEERM